ncbi:Retrovirus pol polyprotein from transposon tnt 1-94 [Pyrenophora tritici-repentis]|nr:Retrovirus pol polyprotein from transposon tnt 1-94 [Pyrenophora tritici-repentis]
MTPKTQTICRLTATGDNVSKWEFMLETYASSILGLDILRGLEPCPILPLNTPTPVFTGDATDATAVAAFTTTPRKDLKEWKQIDANLLHVIITSISDSLLEAVKTTNSTSAAALTLIKGQYKQDGIKNRIKVYGDFYKLSAAHFTSIQAFTKHFITELGRIKTHKFTTKPKEIVLRFLDALEPVLPDYCFRRREEIRRNMDATAAAAGSMGSAGAHIVPVTLSSIINELCDKAKTYHEAFKTTFAASAYLRQPKPTSNGNGNNKKDNKDNTGKPKIACDECGKLHKGSGFQCFYTHPNLAPEGWADKNRDKIAAAKKWKKDKKASTANTFSSNTPVTFAATGLDIHIADQLGDCDFAMPCVASIYDHSNPLHHVLVTVTDELVSKVTSATYQSRVIVDSGSDCHVCNDKTKFITLRPTTDASGIRTGAGIAPVQGIGTIEMTVALSNGSIRTIRIEDVVYCQTFFVTVISHDLLRNKGVFYHGWEEKLLRHPNDTEIAYCPHIDGIPNFLETSSAEDAKNIVAMAGAHARRRQDQQFPRRRMSLQDFHDMFGHINVDDLVKLASSTHGVELTNTTKFNCDVCKQTKSKKNISRKVLKRATKPFELVHIDIVGPVSPKGMNGEHSHLVRFDKMVKVQYDVTLKGYRFDNAREFMSNDNIAYFDNQGTDIKPSTPYTAHQNAVSERANAIVEEGSRAMIIGAPPNLKTLWPHASTYCVLLKNYTPTRALPDGKTPHQALLEAKGAKMAPRARKGFFIGLEGSRIFLMWDSVKRTVIRTSSVDFNQFAEVREESDEYIDIKRPTINLDRGIAPTKMGATTPKGVLGHELKALSPEIPATPPYTQKGPPLQRSRGFVLSSPYHDNPEAFYDQDYTNRPVQYPELPHSSSSEELPQMGTPIGGHISGSFDNDSELSEIQDLEATSPPCDESSDWSCDDEAPRHQEVCSHRHRHRNHPSRAERRSAKRQVYAAERRQKHANSKVVNTISRAFAQAIAESAQAYNLPSKLKNPTEARRHEHKDGWIGAEAVEWTAHTDNDTFTIVSSDEAKVDIYVDNLILITRTKDQMFVLKALIHGKYKCRDLGPINFYLGIKIDRDRVNRTLDMSMQSYIEKVANDHHRASSRKVKKPLPADVLSFKLRSKDNLASTELVKEYQTLVGKLLYPACLVRPDIAFHVAFMGRFD